MSTAWITRLFAVVALMSLTGLARPLSAQSFEDVFESPRPRWLMRATSESGENEADEDEELETDRDSFTFATSTVQRGRVMFEAAHSFIDNRAGADSHSFPELITRIGVTDRLEARLGWNYEVGGGGDVTGVDAGDELNAPGSTTEAKILYGIKYALTEQESWLPASALIAQGSTPTAGPENSSQFILGYVFGWTIFEDWKLDSAIRYANAKEEDDRFSQWAPSIVLKVPVGEQWNAHIEYFGIFTTGSAQESESQYISPGVHYLLTPNCEIGVRVGWGLNEDSANFFSNVGFSLLF